MLIIFGGLPGTGKTEIARELSRQIQAVYLRIDSIEQALVDSRSLGGPIHDAGYCVAYAVAADNLRLGHTVVADSVNPLRVTRDAWLEIARIAGVQAIEIEVVCSNLEEHRRRVETRTPDPPTSRPLAWDEVVSREYHEWHRQRLVLDTARQSVEQNVSRIREILHRHIDEASNV